ncbi:MAG: FAD-dependent oxidoreductase [Gemmatimonadetes bacterium]|nr:FAD-dependent oxidoreductase [Gemmatimonadota bacterium]
MDPLWLSMDRRQAILQLTALAGLVRGEGRRAPAQQRPGRVDRVDVAVIGAGLAGLTATRRLQAAGLTVRLLEARARVGGRVHSTALTTGHLVDRGAQFVGRDHARLIALAAEAQLPLAPLFKTGETLRVEPAGGPVVRQARDASPLGWLRLLDAAQALFRLDWDIDRLAPADRATLDTQSAHAYVSARTLRKDTFAALAAPAANELCVPLDEISAYELLHQLRSVGGVDATRETEQAFLPGGAAGLTAYLQRQVGDALVLNARVTRVARVPDGVAIESTAGSVRARRVIVAVPPQLYGDIGVLPLLPASWRPALAGIRPGAAIKTVLVYERPWWRAAGLSGTVDSPAHPFHSVVDGSPPDGSAGVLVLFTTGRAARRLSGATTEEVRVGHDGQWIRRVFGRSHPIPVAGCSVDWNADALSVGGYASRRGIGGWLAAPDLFAARPPLHFAGTETATQWRSFMEGAIASGERAADDVLGRSATSLSARGIG